MLLSFQELPFIALPDLQNKSSVAVLHVILPFTVVKVSILVFVGSSVAQIVAKSSLEDIPIEKSQLALNLLIITPYAIEDCTLAKVIGSSSFFFALLKDTYILILVKVFEIALTMGKVIGKFTRIGAAITINHPAFAVLAIIMEVSNVVVLANLIYVISVAFSYSIIPLSLVQFLIAIVNSIPMLQVVLPGSIIVCNSIIIEVDSLSLHDAVINESIIDFSIGEDVYSLSVENIVFP